MRGTPTPSPADQLRQALVDLQQANRDFASGYADPERADLAAKQADEARLQAARWANLARAVDRLED